LAAGTALDELFIPDASTKTQDHKGFPEREMIAPSGLAGYCH
jgi:hypothetical protein